jgi:hypothetical protein
MAGPGLRRLRDEPERLELVIKQQQQDLCKTQDAQARAYIQVEKERLVKEKNCVLDMLSRHLDKLASPSGECLLLLHDDRRSGQPLVVMRKHHHLQWEGALSS